MLSTGNDIISLAHVNMQRTRQAVFYDKVLASSELKVYSESAGEMPFELFVWLSWSVKESVFKYLQRHQPDLVFSPIKIYIDCIQFSPKGNIENFGAHQYEAISFHKEFTCYGIVRFGLTALHFKSVVRNDFIFTVVDADESFSNLFWGIKTIHLGDHKSQSAEVRAFLSQRLNFVSPNRRLNIDKNLAGCPIIVDGKEELRIPVSLTHHHNFVAYSFLLSGTC